MPLTLITPHHSPNEEGLCLGAASARSRCFHGDDDHLCNLFRVMDSQRKIHVNRLKRRKSEYRQTDTTNAVLSWRRQLSVWMLSPLALPIALQSDWDWREVSSEHHTFKSLSGVRIYSCLASTFLLLSEIFNWATMYEIPLDILTMAVQL